MASWTREPPKVPGWYWRRSTQRMLPTNVVPIVRSIGSRALGYVNTAGGITRLSRKETSEWWPIPIEPPLEAARAEQEPQP